jgi:hypothetical protein
VDTRTAIGQQRRPGSIGRRGRFAYLALERILSARGARTMRFFGRIIRSLEFGQTAPYSFQLKRSGQAQATAVRALYTSRPLSRVVAFRQAADGTSILYARNEKGTGCIWSVPLESCWPRLASQLNRLVGVLRSLWRSGNRRLMYSRNADRLEGRSCRRTRQLNGRK